MSSFTLLIVLEIMIIIVIEYTMIKMTIEI